MTLIDFYQTKFNSDPYEILYAAYGELAEIAASADIDWNECAPNIQLVAVQGNAEKYSVYTGKYPAALEKKLRGRVEIYSRLETSNNGIKYPFVNFVKKGFGDGSWSGYQFLLSAYHAFNRSSGTAISTQYDEQANQKKIAERRAKRLEHEDTGRRIANQNRHQALMDYLHMSELFRNAPAEDGFHPYPVKKQISPIFKSCDVRRISYWDHGPNPQHHEFMAIPLYHLDARSNGRIVGWQRIYTNSGKYQTRAVDDGEFTGACHVIGNLKGARRVCIVEGFATGASVYMAADKFDAVIVAISANNLINVVEQLVNVYEGVEIWCALDNDEYKAQVEGKGNAGLKTGIEILKKFPSVRCTRPIFPTVDNGQSDFNDLYVNFGHNETSLQLRATENRFRLSDNLLDAELELLSVIETKNQRKFRQQLNKCVDAGMTYCPIKLSPRELVSVISKKLADMGIAASFAGTVRSRVMRRFEQKCQRAQSARSFSERVTNPALRPQHITYKRFNQPQMTNEVLEYVRSLTGPVIVRAGMGSGKSKHLLRPLMHASERGVAVAHRVSLIGGLWDMMTRSDSGDRVKTDILHYQDQGYFEIAPYTNKLAICINSIVKGCWSPLMKNHDFFGLDEATQGLRSTLSGRAMAHPVDVFNQLINSIAVTDEHAVLVDADASDILIDLCELALERREKLGLSPWTQIHVVELPVDVTHEKNGERVARRVLYTDTNRIMTEVLQAVHDGEKFLLATDSTNFAEQLLLQLRERWPEKKWLYVSQDTKPDEEVIAFTDAPNQRAKLYDGLIYSPAISSGVSIESPHFTRHFGSFCGQIIPSDAIQMLRRDRTATEFVVGLGKLPGIKETNEENIKRGFLQALLDTADINDVFTDAFMDSDRMSLGLADTTYVKLKFKIAAMEAMARNDFANNLICILFSDGYDVQHLAEDLELSQIGKDIRKNSKERVWEITVARHMEIETPSNEERDELLAKRSLSESEQAQLARWDIENELKLDVDESSLKFLIDGGKRKLKLAEMMMLDEVTAARLDREQQMVKFTYQFQRANKTEFAEITAMSRDEADDKFSRMQPLAKNPTVKTRPLVEVTQRDFISLHRRVARTYFTDCGIDPDTGIGETNRERLKSAMEKMMNMERADEFNNVLRFGGYINRNGKPKEPETVFRQICEAFGLAPQKRRLKRSQGLGYAWSIKLSSWQFIHDILNQRTADSQSFCTMKLNAGAAETDLDCRSNIDIGSQVGSPKPIDIIELDVIDAAVSGTLISVEWVRSILNVDELRKLAEMPIRIVRATISGLYMTENMGQLTAGQYDELRRLGA
ncbi:hypothetical protein KKJ13_17700 [Xenorhabdus bovienii]|uniref:plasmid replication protein, CyRepA1 family n=2 Tax=Xenorhabdus bovienii TaxID=40576 RepID=UPI0023B24DC7|nr:plasmid replication protein, CyRepA1 family [Xenorhabdus bovienii]MDE9443376.1 hypothetical protein [Xenorhabdus bovienii]